MATIKPMVLIESMSDKVCMHSDVYFRTNKKTGKTTTGKLCNPSTKEPSANQIAARARFAKCLPLYVRFSQDRVSRKPSWWLSTMRSTSMARYSAMRCTNSTTSMMLTVI